MKNRKFVRGTWIDKLQYVRYTLTKIARRQLWSM